MSPRSHANNPTFPLTQKQECPSTNKWSAEGFLNLDSVAFSQTAGGRGSGEGEDEAVQTERMGDEGDGGRVSSAMHMTKKCIEEVQIYTPYIYIYSTPFIGFALPSSCSFLVATQIRVHYCGGPE